MHRRAACTNAILLKCQYCWSIARVSYCSRTGPLAHTYVHSLRLVCSWAAGKLECCKAVVRFDLAVPMPCLRVHPRNRQELGVNQARGTATYSARVCRSFVCRQRSERDDSIGRQGTAAPTLRIPKISPTAAARLVVPRMSKTACHEFDHQLQLVDSVDLPGSAENILLYLPLFVPVLHFGYLRSPT